MNDWMLKSFQIQKLFQGESSSFQEGKILTFLSFQILKYTQEVFHNGWNSFLCKISLFIEKKKSFVSSIENLHLEHLIAKKHLI